jgi:hypothetical protein
VVSLIGILRFSHKQGGKAIVAHSRSVLKSTYESFRIDIFKLADQKINLKGLTPKAPKALAL